MATGGTLKDFEPLSEAEQALVTDCKEGLYCVLGDERPEGPDDARKIRAELLKFLILGGGADCRAHTTGMQLWGAYIVGALDLDFCRAAGQTSLVNCLFDHEISALQTHFELLNLQGSACPGLDAQWAEVIGPVLLNNGFRATGMINLAGAKIGGQLSCADGQFENTSNFALNAQNVDVVGAVFLNDKFHARGEVNLSDIRIGGQLACVSGRFENPKGVALNAEGAVVKGSVFMSGGFHATGTVNIAGAIIGGQFSCADGRFECAHDDALHAERLRVTAGFFWRNVTVNAGRVSFTSAQVGDLVDDLSSWPIGENRLILDGFTYERVTGIFTDALQRLEWLARGTVWDGTFSPSPTANSPASCAAWVTTARRGRC